MNKVLIFSGIYILGVMASSFAQILLKKSADIKRDNKLKEYLNFKTIFAYTIFFSATLCTLSAYKYIPLTLGTILETSGYVFISIFSYIFLKEKISKKKLIGIIAIIIGVLIFS